LRDGLISRMRVMASRDYQLGLIKTYPNKLVNYMHKENYPIAFLS